MQNRHVSLEDFDLLGLIGKGTYGKVLLVRKRGAPESLAMKIIRKELIEAKHQVQHTLAERSILSRMDHPCIVKLRYAFQSKTKLYFVLEYCPGGELFFHLSRVGRFSEGHAQFYAACVVLALEHLHSHDVVYRDLKPENVLIDAQGYAKLTDFGLSKEKLCGSQLTNTACGTPEYLAPEVLLRQGHGRAVDWWSLGSLVYEMLVGLPPFYTDRRSEMFRRILEEDPYLPEGVSPLAQHLIRSLLAKDPMQRLGATQGAYEVKNHPWFAQLDWAQLSAKQASPPFIPNLTDLADTKYFSDQFTTRPINENLQQSPPNDSPTFRGFSYDPSNGQFELVEEARNAV